MVHSVMDISLTRCTLLYKVSIFLRGLYFRLEFKYSTLALIGGRMNGFTVVVLVNSEAFLCFSLQSLFGCS